MKVFISWSGDRSREVAKLLDYWIKCVVQASRPWISTSGIDAGSIWFNQISNELQDTTFGIICLTHENREAPWILFEAGALAKGLATNRVCTFLIDLEPRDIRDPLAQFNHTLPVYESIWKLVSTLNSSLAESSRLSVEILQGVFDTYWPQFETKFSAILKAYGAETKTEPRKQEDILAEILESTRGLERRMRSLEGSGGPKGESSAKAWIESKLSKPSLNALRDFYWTHAMRQLESGHSVDTIRDMLARTPDLSDEMINEIVTRLILNNPPSSHIAPS